MISMKEELAFVSRRHLDNVEDLARAYATALPYPHVVLEEFLQSEIAQNLAECFPPRDQPMQRASRDARLENGRTVQVAKRNYAQGEVDASVEHMFKRLNSDAFLHFLELLSGIQGLLTDPTMRGAGLHATDPGGFLAIHADFNRHPRLGLDRRVNLLLYLNDDWRPGYGGELELWDRDLTACQSRIAPIANRCVIFSTSSWSFHGHPQPWQGPTGGCRKSLAMYYYSDGRPQAEVSEPHATIWPETPGAHR